MTRPRTGTRSPRRCWRLALIALFSLVAVDFESSAHPLAPNLLEIKEQADGQIVVRWKEPLLRATGSEMAPALPESCRTVRTARARREGSGMLYEWTMKCASGALPGQTIGVTGLRGRKANVLLRIEFQDGSEVQELLTGSRPEISIPARTGAFEVARRYLDLGAEHLLTGLDHQLFILGLMLLVSSFRSLVATITCFTLGHALTLSLATLGIARFDPGWIEVSIAFSIVVLAAELARGRGSDVRAGWLRRFPWAMALLFGLLHGLGFASALAEIGLPSADIPLALLSFNLGIELGQLLFISAAAALGLALRAASAWLRSTRRFIPPSGRVIAGGPRCPHGKPLACLGWGRTIPAYGIGTLAAYWCIQQAWSLI